MPTRTRIPIERLPAVPPELRLAAGIGRLVPFVGAGVSKIAGCPGWQELAHMAMKRLAEREKISYAYFEQTRRLSPRVILSLVRSIARERNVDLNFPSLLQPDGWRENEMGQRIYRALSSIGKSFVTTNYDEWLDEGSVPFPAATQPDGGAGSDIPPEPRTVYARPGDFTLVNLSRPGAVIHLHGSLKDPERLVMTTVDYLKHYASPESARGGQRENNVLTFLDDLFRLKTVLFVGYGMEDLEILEHIIRKGNPSAAPGHFMLQGFYSHERDLVSGMSSYFAEFGVTLIPFSLDTLDHAQLTVVLEEFAAQIPAVPQVVSQDFVDMEALLSE